MSEHSPRASRRTFLLASGFGLTGAGSLNSAATAAGTKGSNGRAKSTILFFLCGGASHVDTWDMKPNAPREYRGEFSPIATSAPGVHLCEHLPLLSEQAHHLAVVNSVGATVNTNDHHAGYYHNLTGHVPDRTFRTLGNNRTPFPDDWPFMGSVVAAKRPRHPTLTNAVTLPYKPSRAPYTRPGQFAGRLGVQHDPLYVLGQLDAPLSFRAPALELATGTDVRRLHERRHLLDTIDSARRRLDTEGTRVWSEHRDRAFSLLASSATARAFDVAKEPESLRERYGTNLIGSSLLLARRLVEAEVPFVTVFWRVDRDRLAKKCRSGGGWDTHGNNFSCLKENLLPVFDRAFSALLADLHDRGLLDSTLVMVTSEMGRKPKIGDPRSGGPSGAGRDHWTHCLTNLLAGGGIRGGRTFGSSDKFGEYPSSKPVTPADVAKTVYRAMGIDDLGATDEQGRPYELLSEGRPITALF